MTKELLDLHHLDELKNFVTNIFLKLVIKSRTGIRAIGSSRTGSHALKRRVVTAEQVQLGVGIRVQL